MRVTGGVVLTWNYLPYLNPSRVIHSRDSHLIYKQEVTLLSIYHNTAHNYIVMMPDVNNMELNPYSVETAAGVPWGYQYAVEIEFEDECGEELVMLV